MKLKTHLIYWSIMIIGIILMVVGFNLAFDYSKLPDWDPYVCGIYFAIGFGGFGLLIFGMGFYSYAYKESKLYPDYWEEKERRERKERKRKKREAKRERKKKERLAK